MKPYKIRPTLPWFLEGDVHDSNPFTDIKTPAGVMVYFANEAPEAIPDLLAGIVDAGAGRESLMRDIIELCDMGYDGLAEQLLTLTEPKLVAKLTDNSNDPDEVIERYCERPGRIPHRGKGISEMEFLPPLMEGASDIVRKGVAAVTKLKVCERLEGISVQQRAEDGIPGA